MSRIEWTQKTWNPVRGCSRVSPGCDHCYAMGQARRFDHGPGSGAYGGLTRRRKSDGAVDWSGRVRFVPEQLDVPLRRKKPTVWFVNSMSDLFHDGLTNEQIAAVFGVMAACPQHTFQVLTKRAERMRRWFEWAADSPAPSGLCAFYASSWLDGTAHAGTPLTKDPNGWPLRNVWLGVSAEDQQRADERIPHLLATPAAVRFVSAEPLLGRIDLHKYVGNFCECGIPQEPCDDWRAGRCRLAKPRLDWVIAGGESGPKARPCAIEWIESVVAQCKAADVACFVKQLGSRVVSEHRTCTEDEMRTFVSAKLDDWTPGPHDQAPNGEFWAWRAGLVHRKGGDPGEWPQSLNVRQMPEVRP